MVRVAEVAAIKLASDEIVEPPVVQLQMLNPILGAPASIWTTFRAIDDMGTRFCRPLHHGPVHEELEHQMRKGTESV
eukprot:gene17576-23901_t